MANKTQLILVIEDNDDDYEMIDKAFKKKFHANHSY